jgi:hypothetical protein
MMEAVYTSETSASFYNSTRRKVPEESLHTRRRENLQTHKLVNLTMTYYFSVKIISPSRHYTVAGTLYNRIIVSSLPI